MALYILLKDLEAIKFLVIRELGFREQCFGASYTKIERTT